MTESFTAATLAGFPGQGYLRETETDDGRTVYEGCWKTEEGEEIYAALRDKYLARQTMSFESAEGTDTDVYIASWFGVGHPDCLVVRSEEALE